ncbi:MAG: hypothetical protein K0S41_1857 [Anaerocolumna sp.]|jgi:hypothetical protein|nr:hypothetical protein [Anaerocolumna sp.]
MFHGFNSLQYNGATDDKNNPYNIITERINTAIIILINVSYNKKGVITNYIINPAITILDNKTTSKDTSITRIKNDIANGKCENGSATTYLNGKNVTQETAYYLYWVWDYNEESDEWKFGDKRIT